MGVCFHRDAPAADVLAQARAAEVTGYDEFWVIEDCFFTAGVSLAAAALVATDQIGVGIGIMPAAARNPAITAMEVATLAGLAPGRVHAGIGHGVQDWMGQIGASVESPVTLLDETISAVRALLAGETLTTAGRYVALDDVTLEAPPDPRPLVSAGVRGPKSLAMAGRVADGTVLADFCSPAYLSWARDRIAEGGPGPHRVTVFCSAAVSSDGAEARRNMAHHLAEVCATAPLSLTMAPDFDRVQQRAGDVGWYDALVAMPASWWSTIAPVGTPDDAAAYMEAMASAGADHLAIFPSPFEPIDDATSFHRDVVANLGW